MNRIGVIGAGAWGTALAAVCRRAGCEVILQAREPEVVEAINRDHANPGFLPDVPLDPAIRATADKAEAAARAAALLLVVPAQFLRAALRELKPHVGADTPLVICAKGIEQETGLLMSEVAAAELPGQPLAVLSGPTFAKEVACELPTAVTLAAVDEELAHRLADLIGTPSFRPYWSTDVVGAEIGGAVKNVLAIACGIVEGRKLGDNARAALITRGLAELARLARAKGAHPETLMGLSGLGDLTLTCNAMQSRNFSLGVALGRGRTLADVLAERNSVAEGVASAAAAGALARTLGVDMPICGAVDAILHGGADIDATIRGLMERPFTHEN